MLLVVQVRRVAGGVRQRAGVGDRADEGGDAAVVSAQLEDLLDDGAVLALELAGAAVHRNVVRVGLHLDAQSTVGAGLRRADATAVLALEGHGAPPPGRRRRSATAATVPTDANSSPLRGTSTTRSSSPTSIASVTVMVGKTTESSTGTSSIVSISFSKFWGEFAYST